MELNNERIRVLLNYEFHSGLSADKAIERICKAYGEKAVSRTTAYKWYARFRDGDESLEDHPHTGRPQNVDRVDVLLRIEEDPSLTTRKLGEEFGCSHFTIQTILHEEGNH